MIDLLLWHGRSSPAKTAALVKRAGTWQEVTWGEVLERTRRLSEGLLRLGIAPGDRVCIFAQTGLEWCLADLAIQAAGAVPVPIYGSDTPDEIAYIVNDSGAKTIIFDHDRPDGKGGGRWTRLRSAGSRMPTVERSIAFELASNVKERLVGFGELEALGEESLKASPGAFEERARQIGPEDLNCILYTSGTTGLPKGVMLTQGNWTSQARAISGAGVLTAGDVVLLFLPLAHSFARVVEAAWVGQGFTLAFAEAIEKAADNAAEVKATVMPAVPRVFEKAYSKVTADGAAQTGVQGKLFAWAMRQFEEYAAARISGRETTSTQWALARRIVFSKIAQKLKDRFGGKMRLFVSGGAPLSRKIGLFFDVCGLVILEGYGLTETSAPTHVNRPGKARLGTVGQPFPDTDVRIAPDGEILLRGPMIMKGYYKMPEATASVLDEEGFFHTGDIGEVDPDGYLTITDRKKDLIKTSGGKYIAPQELENALKTEPLVSQVAILGDKRRFVSALMTLSEESLAKLAQERNLQGLSYAELTARPEVRERIQAAVDALNSRLPSYATVKKFALLNQDWSQQSGELTPKMSVKRKVVAEKYKSLIDGLYEGEAFE